MNTRSFEQAKGLVKASYVSQGEQALNSRRKLVTALLSNRRLPPRGWDDAQIEFLLQELSLMDSNSFVDNVGVGEREGRVYCSLVARRNYRFSHGVGRSGDVAEVQPKAAGSSLLAKLCHALAGDALKIAGLSNARASLVLPMATGMSLALTFSALRAKRPGATFIVWTRMDQKSCFKAIVAAGFTPIVVENLIEKDAVTTNVAGVKAAVERCGAERVLCVVTTTSCFAPRLPDKVDEIARICSSAGVGHVINNAYGVQCSKTCRLINRAMAVGRVDAVVQSTDKNFMVPVGGAVVCGPNAAFVEEIGKAYAGRASAGPCLDLFITLLSMGQAGWQRLLSDREALVDPFRERLQGVAERNGERLLDSSGNTISFAITLDTLTRPSPAGEVNGGVAFLGSMLFTRCVSGTRVVPREQRRTVAGVDFAGYGASARGYPHDYLTAACAVGLSPAELDEFCLRLDKAIRKVKGTDAQPPKSAEGCGEGGLEAAKTSVVRVESEASEASTDAAVDDSASGDEQGAKGGEARATAAAVVNHRERIGVVVAGCCADGPVRMSDDDTDGDVEVSGDIVVDNGHTGAGQLMRCVDSVHRAGNGSNDGGVVSGKVADVKADPQSVVAGNGHDEDWDDVD